MFKTMHILVIGLMAIPLLQVCADDEEAEQQPQAGGIRIFGNANGRFEFNGRFGGSSLQISKTTVNGVTTIKAVEDGVVTEIIEDPDNGITVATTKTYDSSNADELKEKNPAIFDYLKKAPQGMGEVQYRFKVDVIESCSAKDAEELKKNHPEAHALYEKYSKGAAGNIFRIEVAPGVGGALPNGFRVPDFKFDNRLENFERRVEEFQERFQRQLEQAQPRLEAKPPLDNGRPDPEKPGVAT